MKGLPSLRTRTEYSFKVAVGKLESVIAMAKQIGMTSLAITDRNGTWGHINFKKLCKSAGIKPIFGVELALVDDAELREKQKTSYVTLLARNNSGLRELYDIVTLSSEKFYYQPRVDFDMLEELSNDVAVIYPWDCDIGKVISPKLSYIGHAPGSNLHTIIYAEKRGMTAVACSDNSFAHGQDRELYEIIIGQKRANKAYRQHILDADEWTDECGRWASHLSNACLLADSCNATLPTAELINPKSKKTITQMCMEGAKKRNMLKKGKMKPEYEKRLAFEIDTIESKKFQDYFFIVADMIQWAKERMFVGPARGSSCGSIVCYLLEITDIDPMPFDLLFERFIDMNREDLPDIDIDFPDDKRDSVIEYCEQKYGKEHVSRLGTVNVFKPKSAIGHAAKELLIPVWEVSDLKDSMIERSSGDSRASFCIADTLMGTENGRAVMAKYPELSITEKMEGHASHTGMHAAGIVITAAPVANYCSINTISGVAMIDKKGAEEIGALKIDALGLRTLTILQDCLDAAGKTTGWLKAFPLDDKKAFDVINKKNFAGIFQFEGYALQSICHQMVIESFEDVASITALARPGPLSSGGSAEFVKRRNGSSKIVHLHKLVEPYTKVTHGVIVYQEQVMQITRHVGALSWEDVSQLRKAMSRSLGKEFFDGYWKKFWSGAKQKGLTEEEAQYIWDHVNTMGSWAFNRSHAVAYGMISYWSMVLKAHFPLEFAAACLRNAKDDDQSIRILRELVIEGHKYKPFDRHRSSGNWTVSDGVLIGGLTAIKGVGKVLSANIIRKRAAKQPFTDREEHLLSSGITPWDRVFECADLWGHIIKNPTKYAIESKIWQTADIMDDSNGSFVFFGKLKDRNLRDHNEIKALMKRGGKKMEGQTKFLNIVVEDDTGIMNASVNRFNFELLGQPLISDAKLGDWFMWKGKNRAGFRRPSIIAYRKLTGNEKFML